jgi:hypothetical protein
MEVETEREQLRKRVERGAIERAERDLKMAEEWNELNEPTPARIPLR